MCFTGSESPVVVVLSGSMEPGFKRVSLESKKFKMTISILHWAIVSVCSFSFLDS